VRLLKEMQLASPPRHLRLQVSVQDVREDSELSFAARCRPEDLRNFAIKGTQKVAGIQTITTR